MVDVKFERMMKRYIPLSELKSIHQEHEASGGGPLSNIALFTRARLSVQPISPGQFRFTVNVFFINSSFKLSVVGGLLIARRTCG